MCSGSVLKKMLLFALPLMCSSMLQLLFNAADIIVVGRFAGDDSLAAVGSNTALINLLTNLFIGLSIGANVIAAKEFGAKKNEELHKTVHTSMLLSICGGIFLTVIGVIFAPQILTLMKTPGNVNTLAAIYLRVFCIGMPASMVYNFGSALLRSIGDTKRPLYYLFSAGIVNVILNLFFVIILKLGVVGVALATVISQSVSAVLVVRCLMKEEGGIKLVLSQLRIDKEKFKNILRIGLPAGFQGIVFALSNVVIQSSVNLFGETVVAGNSAACNIEGFIYVAMNSFYQAAISFTSQNIGAGRYDRLGKIAVTGQLCVIATGLVTGWTALFLGSELLSIYSQSTQVISAGMDRMRVILSVYALCGMMDVMVGILRGMGYSVMPMIVSLLGACGLRLLWIATIFQVPQYHNVFTIYISYPISWLITLSVYIVFYMFIRKKLPLA